MAELFVADVKRLTIHDGPGIRDTVFLKGCPLHCLWCHNPETLSGRQEILFIRDLCISCRRCQNACPQSRHSFKDGGHLFARNGCLHCGKCADACFQNALRLCGRKIPVAELAEKLLQDRTFFTAGGGVTVSGGEPLLQADGVAELFRLLRAENIHTALDTCGAVPQQAVGKVLPFTSLVLFDLKGMDPQRHKDNTGMDNELIHKNLRYIDDAGVPLEVRMPIVPQHNDFPDDITSAAKLLSSLRNLERVRLLAYHDMAGKKYAESGIANTMPQVQPPTQEELEKIRDILQKTVSAEILLP